MIVVVSGWVELTLDIEQRSQTDTNGNTVTLRHQLVRKKSKGAASCTLQIDLPMACADRP